VRSLLELQKMGFTFTVKEGSIQYQYHLPGAPDPERVRALLEDIRCRREEALRFLNEDSTLDRCYGLVCESTSRIASIYTPGLIEWAKSRVPQRWQKIEETEREVDRLGSNGMCEDLKKALASLEALWRELEYRRSIQKEENTDASPLHHEKRRFQASG
jgi:hypothetical protein